jgi:hypothetical protein
MSTSFKGPLVRAFLLSLLLPVSATAQQGQAAPAAGVPPPIASGFTRSLVGPTARMLKPGEFYVAGVAIVIPIVQVGVTNWLELGGGAWPGGAYWVTPKFQIHKGERTSVAAGLVHAFAPGDDGGQLGVAYVVATRESGQGAWTYGGGVAYARDNQGESGVVPVFQVGGERRLSRHVWFLSENYLFGPAGIVSAGLRVQGKHASFDVAVPVFIDGDGAFPGFLASVGFRFGG